MRAIFGAAIALTMMAPASYAQDVGFLGFGYQISNDFIGDARDRWRTGATQASVMFGRDWQGSLGSQYFDTLELRGSAEIAAPDNLDAPAQGDRPYASVARLGVHSHFNQQLSRTDFDMGVGVEVIGPQTKLDEFQANFHRWIGASDASDEVRAGQIQDNVFGYGHIEAARTFELGDASRVIPFIEGHAGLESFARVGADFEFGALIPDDLIIRDYTTGQTYTAIRGTMSALTLTAGADIGYMVDSAMLPDSDSYDMVQERARARAGLKWEGRQSSATFGVTYLSKEFDNQDTGQVLGSFNLKYKF
ncbi:lipid A-modifier LpxR family protein [Donghicola sp.]|uniref:lipid A-modifier LpxR family protein n=1 Tax=Donghicola sp. TaxID=1929294 RepID=UPI0025FC4998|nr:lipid A-modifier LpxR family protein [Donghicola sp.]MCT4577917.1 lipid A deacylase LpxR family protein [Donghicola sp.]